MRGTWNKLKKQANRVYHLEKLFSNHREEQAQHHETTPSTKIFGVPLLSLLQKQYSTESSLPIPIMIKRCIDFIYEKGTHPNVIKLFLQITHPSSL